MSDQPISIQAEPEWAAFVAIDWGNQKHFWILQPAAGGNRESGELPNSPEAISVWVLQLDQRFGGRPVAVALEQKRGAVVNMLLKYKQLILYPVPPAMSASYRRAFSPSGAKDDPGDAAMLLDLLLRHRQQLRPWHAGDDQTHLLQFLVEDRRRLVAENTRQMLRLQDCLKQYFPQMLQWFHDLDTALAGALLEKWPTLQDLQHQHPGTLTRFFREHHGRRQKLIQERIDAVYTAVPATSDGVILEACSRKTRSLVRLIQTLRQQIAEYDLRIRELETAHPDSALFHSLPGAGPQTVARLIAAFGTDRDRFQSAYPLLCYSGIAPVLEASGKTAWTHFRRSCPKFLRQTFQEYAGLSLRQSEWANAYYEQQRARGKGYYTAVRALAYKWIRIIFRCWKDHKLYDEQQYLQSTRRRAALVGSTLSATTAIGWKSVGGFQTLSKNPS